MKDKAKYTNELLKQVSDHITSRQKHKYKSFVLYIDEDGIELMPYVTVFPDIHHRQPSDKEELINHILIYHMAYILDDRDTSIRYSDYFSTGQYKFAIPYGSRNRKWVKLK